MTDMTPRINALLDEIGITPGPWLFDHRAHVDPDGQEWYSTEVFSDQEPEKYICRLAWLGEKISDSCMKSMRPEHAALLSAARDAMVALIDTEYYITVIIDPDGRPNNRRTIEKATGKSWQWITDRLEEGE